MKIIVCNVHCIDEDRCTVYSDGSTQKSCVNKRSTKENNYAAMIVCFSFLSTFVCIAFTIIWCHPLVKENEQLRNQVIMLQSHISSNFTQQILYPTPPAYDIKDHDHLLPGTAQYNNTEILLQNYSVAPALIVMFDLTEKIANEEKWKSEPFFAFEKGYLMYLSVYPGGHDDGKGSHVSVYLHLMKGPYDDELEQSGYWPMRGTFSIGLLDVDNHGYYFTINYFVCELCTFRVKEGSEAPSGLGFPEYISHKSLPIYNKYDSLGFLISYRNRPEEAITSMIPIFQNRLRLLIDNFIKCLSHLWPVIVIPVAMDLLFKYDVVYCLQTIIFPLVKDQIMTVMAMEILLGADLMLAMLAKYTNVDDSVYAPLHCVFVRLVIISAGTYLASIINFVVSLLLLLSEYL